MKKILPAIVVSQFFCTSLWFAGNAVMSDIAREFHVQPSYVAHLTSAVQLGFIAGTLVFAILGIADRFKPSVVFFTCALIAAGVNLAINWDGISIAALITMRFLTGFFLAGIYPVGMKIASDHYRQGLGESLGFLVGALVLGTAFPHLLRGVALALPWRYVMLATSVLAVAGGLIMILLVPDGQYHRRSAKMSLVAFVHGFRSRNFRVVAYGYFGHMWELYAFWVFVPAMLMAYNAFYPGAALNVPLWSFFIIAAGSVACVLSGLAAQRFGARLVATAALLISCACCLVSPLLLLSASPVVFLAFLFVWSMAVIADSPLFSTLVADNAPQQIKGTSLTFVISIGFLITIPAIQLIGALQNRANARYIYTLLAIGPVLGLAALLRNKNTVVQ